MTTIADALMDTRNDFPGFGAFLRSLFVFLRFALRFGKISFIFTEKAWILDISAVRNGSKLFDTHINSDGLIILWQRNDCRLNRKSGKPFLPLTFHSASFDVAFDFSMDDRFDNTNLRKSNGFGMESESSSRIAKGIVPIPFHAGEPGRFACFDSAKECLEC